jgi:hypothetical protein
MEEVEMTSWGQMNVRMVVVACKTGGRSREAQTSNRLFEFA